MSGVDRCRRASQALSAGLWDEGGCQQAVNVIISHYQNVITPPPTQKKKKVGCFTDNKQFSLILIPGFWTDCSNITLSFGGQCHPVLDLIFREQLCTDFNQHFR